MDSLPAEVVHTIDGDTVRITARSKIYNLRFLNIDTPETNFQGNSQGHWAEKASARLAELLPAGSPITVQLGIEKCDHYGRMLGVVFRNGRNINKQMLSEGLAVNYCIWPNIDCEDLAVITGRNIQRHVGIYSDSSVELPYEWRRQMSNRPHEKFVGNIFTREVYRPGSYDQVAVGERVFFLRESDIQAPFFLVD